LYGFAPEEVQAQWLPQLRASASAEEIERFLARVEMAVAGGYIRSSSEFVDGVTDMCVPVMGIQGAVASLIVPFIQIKSQALSQEQVVEKLRLACRRIADLLND